MHIHRSIWIDIHFHSINIGLYIIAQFSLYPGEKLKPKPNQNKTPQKTLQAPKITNTAVTYEHFPPAKLEKNRE